MNCVLIFTTEELKAHPITKLLFTENSYPEASVETPRTKHQDQTTVSKILREIQQMIFFFLNNILFFKPALNVQPPLHSYSTDIKLFVNFIGGKPERGKTSALWATLTSISQEIVETPVKHAE